MTAAELVERVAIALEREAVIEELSDDHIDRHWNSLARAAIAETLAAIREPTQAMREAGGTALLPKSIDFADEVWRVMRDALAAEIRGMK